MDTWLPVHGRPDVTYILREMYSSVAVCVANRSDASVQVIVDCSHSTNAVLLCADPQRLPATTLALRYPVAAGQTVVVGVLSPLEAAQVVGPAATVHVVPVHAANASLVPGAQAGDAAVDQTPPPPPPDVPSLTDVPRDDDAVLGAAEASTGQVSAWLAQRRQGARA